MVVPAQNLNVETVRRVRKAGRLIAEGLNLNGPFNIQFLAKSNHIKVIECNARAARSFPFVSKVIGLNLADAATDVIIGRDPELKRINEDDLPYVGVKAAMFSFARLAGADPVLGVEMASTGEVGCIGETFDEALLLALEASRCSRPKKGVLVSAGTESEKMKFLKSAQFLKDLGIPLFATSGTSKFLTEHGFDNTQLDWPGESEDDCVSAIREGRVDMVINIAKSMQHDELTRGANVRRVASQFGCSLLTNMEKTNAFFKAMADHPDFLQTHKLIPLLPYRNQ